MLQFQICYHSHLNVPQKKKTNVVFRGQTWVRSPAKCWVKGYFTEASGILQLNKNPKTNNIAGYHLVSCLVISIPSDVLYVHRCPKRIFILLQKHRASVSNMLSQLLKCVIKKENEHIWPNLVLTPRKVTKFYPISIMLQIFTEDSVIF